MNYLKRHKNILKARASFEFDFLFSIHSPMSFVRLTNFISECNSKEKKPDYLTLRTAASILSMPQEYLEEILNSSELLPHVLCSNGDKLISPEALENFILDVHWAYGRGE